MLDIQLIIWVKELDFRNVLNLYHNYTCNLFNCYTSVNFGTVVTCITIVQPLSTDYTVIL